MMNWITEKQAAEAAKQGKIPALECSLLHWQQPGMVGYVELAAVMEDKQFHIGPAPCACCQIYNTGETCGDCPLLADTPKDGRCCCGGLYAVASNTYTSCERNHYSNASMQAFQEAAAEVCKFIADVLEKEKAKEKKKCEPELQHGDVRLWGIGDYLQEFIVDLSDDGINCLWANGDLRNKKSEREIRLNSIFLCNIFDDLKRNSEDLREFEVCAHGNSNCVFKATLEGSDNIVIDSDNWNYPLKDVVKIHQQLGQIIAFAKRQENKK